MPDFGRGRKAVTQALEAKIRKLREVLERIDEMVPQPPPNCACGRPTGLGAIKACARAALKGDPT